MKYSTSPADTLTDERLDDGLLKELAATVLNHAPIGLAVLEDDGLQVRLANPHLCSLLDEPYRSEGITGLRLDQVVPTWSESGIAALVQEARRSGRVARRKAVRLDGFRDGPMYWDIVAASLATESNEHPIVLHVLDTTAANHLTDHAGVETSRIEQFEQLKDDFLAVTSHELRTPVTALLGYTNLMVRRADQGDWTDRDRHALRMIQAQARRLAQLINGLVDIAQIQTGDIELRYQPLELDVLARQVAGESRTMIGDHTIEVEGAEQPVIVWGDAQRLEQVLTQLIDNALKYSPWGGAVQLRIWADTEAHLAVMDAGIGIPEDAIPQLFQRFYRATNVDSDRISGLGIGLYLVKEVVTAHGGRINVQSAPGSGTTIELVLPLYSGE